MKYFLIMNPGSRSGRSGKTFNRIFGLMANAGIQFDHALTQSLDDARSLSREMNGKAYDAIIAVGGDGTINAVINGFFNEHGHRISPAKFGVIYTGTSPDFCRSYNIPCTLESAVDRLARGTSGEIQIGRISFSSDPLPKNGMPATMDQIQYFACCANIGLGAALARRANGGIRKYMGDFAGTFLSLIITLIGFKSTSFNCIVDGKHETVERMVNTSVGITPFIASGIKVPVGRNHNKGTLYCMTVKNLKIHRVIPLLKKVYRGRHFANSDYLSLNRCTEIEFRANARPAEVEFDGDPAGYLPCRISLAKDTLELIM